jgi:hypothetical protein
MKIRAAWSWPSCLANSWVLLEIDGLAATVAAPQPGHTGEIAGFGYSG